MDISAALGSATTALELLRLGVKARDDAKVQAALTDVNMRLLDLSTAALALTEKNRSLESELADVKRERGMLQAQLAERALYSLDEVRPGVFAYAMKDPSAAGLPAHYICQACYDQGSKVVLQRSGNGRLLLCPTNGSHNLRIENDPHPPPVRSTFRPF